MVCVFKQQMLYFIGAKTESQIGQKWPKMYPGTLKILKFPGGGTPDPPPHSGREHLPLTPTPT